jgi:hypothetical protein
MLVGQSINNIASNPNNSNSPNSDSSGGSSTNSPTDIHRPDSAPQLRIDDQQFGSKVGKHAQDYGLDPGDPQAREWVRQHIDNISRSPNEVRQGPWNPKGGGGSDDWFFRQGEDVVVAKNDGTFVTILKGGQSNGWFNSATVVK